LLWGFSLVIFNVETEEFVLKDEKTAFGVLKSDEIVVQVSTREKER
jgi:hypothetical protein